MYNQQVIPDSGFQVKGLNIPGVTQPSDSNRSNFTSEATMDAALSATVPAKDRPYLTMNDKVFATRYAVPIINPSSDGATNPESLPPESEPEPEPGHSY